MKERDRKLRQISKKYGIPLSEVKRDSAQLRRLHQTLVNRYGMWPIKGLRESIKDERWLEGVVLSTTFLEGIGISVLKGRFKGQIEPERIEHLRVEQIIMFLYASGIISQSIYSKMVEVNRFRNEQVHKKDFTPLKLRPDKAEEIVKKAIICLKTLIKEYYKNMMHEEVERLELPAKTE